MQISLQSKNEEVKLLRKNVTSEGLTVEEVLELPIAKAEIIVVEAPQVSASEIQVPLTFVSESAELKLQESLQKLYRLADYMTRSQQLVTMLVAQNRATPQVKEAMRRVDWELVQKSSLIHFKEVIEKLQDLDSLIKKSAKNVVSPAFEKEYKNKNLSDQTQWTI